MKLKMRSLIGLGLLSGLVLALSGQTAISADLSWKGKCHHMLPFTAHLSEGSSVKKALLTITPLVFVAACGGGDDKGSAGSPHSPISGPLKVLPANSRYFSDADGRPVYLSGSHTHTSLQDLTGQPSLSFEALLDFLLDHGHNFTKLWRHENTEFAPLPFQRAGSEVALDGLAKFDLAKFDSHYFEDLRARAAVANQRGIYVDIMLFNGFSVESKNPGRQAWTRHPFHRDNNVNGIDGDLDGDDEGREVHTLLNPAVTAIQKAYVKNVIDAVNDLDNVLYEIVNEDTQTAENTAWQYHMIDYIHEYERTKPKQHPVGMTAQWPNESNQALFESPAEWISPYSMDRYKTDPPPDNLGKVILNDTDHLWGNGGNADWAWMSFTRGLNPIFMDVTPPLSTQFQLPQAEEIRVAIGDTRDYAQRIDLENMTPRQDLCSTTFCLAKLGQEYLIFVPSERSCSNPAETPLNQCMVTVDLSDVEKPLTVEWFSTDTRERKTESLVPSGSRASFNSPFSGPAVLYLKVAQPQSDSLS